MSDDIISHHNALYDVALYFSQFDYLRMLLAQSTNLCHMSHFAQFYIPYITCTYIYVISCTISSFFAYYSILYFITLYRLMLYKLLLHHVRLQCGAVVYARDSFTFFNIALYVFTTLYFPILYYTTSY